MELQSHLERFEAAGAEVWAVTGDEPARLESFRDTEGIGFTILLDPEGSTFESYGILNENYEIAGRAIDGPLRGQELTWAKSIQCRWYAWASEYPKTSVFEKSESDK